MIRLLQLIIIYFVLSSSIYAAVNINTASQSELEVLKGIGPAKAKAIVEYRNEHGLFSSVDDLEKVSGIGAGTLKQIRNDLTVGDTSVVGAEEKIAVEQKK
ncbi:MULTISPECIES: ComEA family DNA-binding protein [unclassified Nitrosomonas]|uniref:ComEA family DNA-binding protein n=1 Tax=unclassified Nitrosomonas TaxID=2609265 RepID=UPI00089BC81B|nr:MULTISPECIES: ComEA family DNA-binding protein [unclassified Nitrosomonas]MDV6345418.1 ComEA family DNA-binding protein [Nitrosomonas sp. Is37]SDY58411.1 competence protein ComEA [Nitrosomonas sp. Nm33]